MRAPFSVSFVARATARSARRSAASTILRVSARVMRGTLASSALAIHAGLVENSYGNAGGVLASPRGVRGLSRPALRLLPVRGHPRSATFTERFAAGGGHRRRVRSEEHTSELQSPY